jgi:hypothetical protein
MEHKMDRPINDLQDYPTENGEGDPKDEALTESTVGSEDNPNLPMKSEDVVALETWISQEVEAKPTELEKDDWHEALARAKEKRRDAEKLLARARMEKEEAIRMMEEVRENEIRAQKDNMKAEEEGEERVAAVLGQARLAERDNERTVEDARTVLQDKLEELDALREAHRKELEVVTNLFRGNMRHNASAGKESSDPVDEQGSNAAEPVSAVHEKRSKKKKQDQPRSNANILPKDGMTG